VSKKKKNTKKRAKKTQNRSRGLHPKISEETAISHFQSGRISQAEQAFREIQI